MTIKNPMGLTFFENSILFTKRGIEESGILRGWDSFSVYVSDIKIIAYRLGHLLDDEEISILIVDSKSNIYGFSANLEWNSLYYFKEKFNLDINNIKNNHSTWDYELCYNEIVYPPQLKGKHLFYCPKYFFEKLFWYFFYDYFNFGVNKMVSKINKEIRSSLKYD